jgi:hypothetical protein
MPLDRCVQFLRTALEEPAQHWSRSGLAGMALMNVPDLVLGRHQDLLRADVYRLWAEWFLEAIYDPGRLGSQPGYAILFSETERVVNALFPALPADERTDFTRQLARMTLREVERRKVRRIAFTRSEREEAYVNAGPEPRCWICGHEFAEWAKQKFLRRPYEVSALPLFVDVAMPRLSARDFMIEIDHVVPVGSGGTNVENLRLACGRCNVHKRDRLSIYDVGSRPYVIRTPDGDISRPRPFWVVRVLVSRPRCENEEGCTWTVANAELTVAPRYAGGAMNPVNMRVTCSDHDPLGSRRLVPRSLFDAKTLPTDLAA